MVNEGRCDFLSGAPFATEQLENPSYTRPYLSIPIVIATRLEEVFIDDLAAMGPRRVAVVDRYAIAEMLHQHYPALQVVSAASVEQGLHLVEQGVPTAWWMGWPLLRMSSGATSCPT